jgi:hypothetical protein
MRTDLARRIVRLYPLAWRARYEAELLALVGTSPVSLSVVADLLAGAIREQIRAAAAHLDAPPENPNRELRRDLMITFATSGAMWVVAEAIGAVLRGLSVQSPWLFGSPFVFFAFLIRSIVSSLPRS